MREAGGDRTDVSQRVKACQAEERKGDHEHDGYVPEVSCAGYPVLVLSGEVLSTGFFHSQPQGPVGSSLGPDQTQEPRVSLYARLLP